MKKHSVVRHLSILLVLVLLLSLFAACGAGSADKAAAPMEHPSGEASLEGGADFNASGEPTQTGAAEDVAAAEEAGVPPAQAGRKLIRNFNMSLETRQFDRLYQDIREQAAANGGYFENSSLHSNGLYDNSTRSASLVIRIPANKADAFLQQLTKSLGEDSSILYQNESLDDVTLKYTDVESHKKSLETEQKRLLELLEKAETIEDIIAMESRLSEVRYELENYASQLRQFDNQIDYCTFYLDLNEVRRLDAAEQDNVWTRMSKGLSKTFGNIADGAQDAFVFVVVNFPYLLTLALLIVLAVLVVRRKHRRIRLQEAPLSTPKQRKTKPIEEADANNETTDSTSEE